MRKITNINDNWKFIKADVGFENAVNAEGIEVNVPHTWNNIDGADGGNDYYRATCWYVKKLTIPEEDLSQTIYLEFKGVNASAEVFLNGESVAKHDGGYSTFRANITGKAKAENVLCISVDNSVNDRVYPQTADFTFYGGIYRDVNVIVVPENHFDLDYYGAKAIKITPVVKDGKGILTVDAYPVGEGEVIISVYDGNKKVAEAGNGEVITFDEPHLWNGIEDPFLYKAVATLYVNGEVADEVSDKFGFRFFSVDPDKGFFLNGKSYPLRGVCRHQDRKGMGNAITKKEHEEDIAYIKEIGANTVRLAHYQHDDYFYDLCDEAGFVVWAEIPYISKHMPNANENAISQMKELIYQQYNHASICFWGVSNEITMFHVHTKDMIKTHKILNDLCHEIDPTRLTTLACYAMCGFFNKSAHITDVVSWNLYLGWYVPGFFLNDVWFAFFRLFFPKRVIGMSEYGAEGMPNLHAIRPKRGDNTEEYQNLYHEYMLKFYAKHDYFWATHVWNMYDFAADARNQGGEPGMNHKGLMTYDRKTKKDTFYLYKAYWTKDPFVYIAGRRFTNRTGKTLKIKVYSNTDTVALYQNGQLIEEKKGDKVFEFKMPMQKVNEIVVKSGDLSDTCIITHVDKPDPSYKVAKIDTKNWQK